MKLLYCYKCNDVIRLQPETRHCKCGLTKGKYKYRRYAEYEGDYAIPLWLDDASLKRSARLWGDRGRVTGMSLHFIDRGDQRFTKVRASNLKLRKVKFELMTEEQFREHMDALDRQYLYVVEMENNCRRKRGMDAEYRQKKIDEFKQLQEDIMYNKNRLHNRKAELVVHPPK